MWVVRYWKYILSLWDVVNWHLAGSCFMYYTSYPFIYRGMVLFLSHWWKKFGVLYKLSIHISQEHAPVVWHAVTCATLFWFLKELHEEEKSQRPSRRFSIANYMIAYFKIRVCQVSSFFFFCLWGALLYEVVRAFRKFALGSFLMKFILNLPPVLQVY
jgi:hypothetical protein